MDATIMCTYYYPYDESSEDLPKTYLASSAPELARHLAGRGHDINVISRQVAGTDRVTEKHEVTVKRVPFVDVPVLRFLTWFFAAFFAVLKEDNTRYLCWDWSTAAPVILASYFRPVKIACSVRNSAQAYRHRNSVFYPVYWLIEKYVYTQSDYVIYASEWVRETVQEVMTVDVPSTVLHQGIDADMFSPEISGEAVRSEYELEGFVIGFFGRLAPIKGVADIFEAASQLEESFTVFLVGEGPLEDDLRDAAAEHGIRDKVVFAGFKERDQIPRYMAACDAILLPSSGEGFSSVVVEAMAMGKVFIGTPVGGAPEVVQSGVNGFLVDEGQPDEIASLFSRLASDVGERERIGDSARSFIEEEYAWPAVVSQWERFIEGMHDG